MVPCLEVSRLPPSSSFYSAILQPLGFRYLSTEDGEYPSITFGSSLRNDRFFLIRQVRPSRERPLKVSRIVLSSPSAVALEDIYDCALRTNPDIIELSSSSEARSVSGASIRRTYGSRGEPRVVVSDFDGNMVDVVYRPPSDAPAHYGGQNVRYTKSTSDEAARILDWNYEVVGSAARTAPRAGTGSAYGGSTYSRRPSVKLGDDDYDTPPSLKRSYTTRAPSYDPPTTQRQSSSGISGTTIAGTLLGLGVAAVAGGALYNYSKRDRSSRQDYDEPPSFARRSTFPTEYSDRYPEHTSRYVDVDRPVEKARYPEEYPPVSDRRPEYITRYSHADVPRSDQVGDAYDDMYEELRGRHWESRSRASTRPRSAAASNRHPMPIAESEHRSYISSKSSKHPPIVQRSYTYDTPEANSYVSARSHRSSNTIRASPPAMGETVSRTVSRSKAGTRVTTTTTIKVGGDPPSPRSLSRHGTYVSARQVPLPGSEYSARQVPLPPSVYSAREVPLPASRIDYDDGSDGEDSIVPSDSISCVGSRRSGRSYRH